MLVLKFLVGSIIVISLSNGQQVYYNDGSAASYEDVATSFDFSPIYCNTLSNYVNFASECPTASRVQTVDFNHFQSIGRRSQYQYSSNVPQLSSTNENYYRSYAEPKQASRNHYYYANTISNDLQPTKRSSTNNNYVAYDQNINSVDSPTSISYARYASPKNYYQKLSSRNTYAYEPHYHQYFQSYTYSPYFYYNNAKYSDWNENRASESTTSFSYAYPETIRLSKRQTESGTGTINNEGPTINNNNYNQNNSPSTSVDMSPPDISKLPMLFTDSESPMPPLPKFPILPPPKLLLPLPIVPGKIAFTASRLIAAARGATRRIVEQSAVSATAAGASQG